MPAVPVPPAVDGPVERLLADYRRYLARERGLAAGTIANYRRVARLFLTDREHRGLALERLTAGDVSRFLGARVPEAQCAAAQGIWQTGCARCCAICT